MISKPFRDQYGYNKFDPFYEDRVFSYMANTTKEERKQKWEKPECFNVGTEYGGECYHSKCNYHSKDEPVCGV